jgi:hypothetical protein
LTDWLVVGRSMVDVNIIIEIYFTKIYSSFK